MQDIFAVSFDFKKGEQPTHNKLNGWIKQTDSAFSDITQAVGDPWDYQVHSSGGDSVKLSPENLSQASLARMIGPADWVSPHGASWNESCSATILLSANRNSWSLGYPIVQVSNTITPQSGIDSVASFGASFGETTIWADNVTITGTGHSTYFANRKDTPEEVVVEGDYYVDFMAGIITSYSIVPNQITLTINNLYMFGPGVPWATANVIPTWNGGPLCYVAEDTDSGLESTYTISLPTVDAGTRASGTSLKGAGDEVTYSNKVAAGQGANYRLPYSIVSGFAPDTEIPDGFMFVWDGARIVPNLTFRTIDDGSGNVDPHKVQVVGVSGVLGADGHSVSLILTGTSLAESVNYLMHTLRGTTHSGLSGNQDSKSLNFTNPISHKSLSNRWGGDIGNVTSDVDDSMTNNRFIFVESAYPTNDHPQYLHRAGYMAADDANSKNAMRGDLVFSNLTTFAVGNANGGLDSETSGIKFGGGGNKAAYLSFVGGESSTNPIPFGIDGVGIIEDDTDRYGAVTFKTAHNRPFYLKSSDGATGDYNSGVSIAFDYKSRNEMNYIKLLPLDRDSGTDDPKNYAAKMTANASLYDTVLDTGRHTSTKRISPEQTREWRFRSVASLEDADTDTGLSGLGSDEKYFTSPGIVGADWFNVYSNAIFFSEQGDGKATSLHQLGPNWMNNNTDKPVGLYYKPSTNAFEFYSGYNNEKTYKNASFSRGYINLRTSNISDQYDVYTSISLGDKTISMTAREEMFVTVTEDIRIRGRSYGGSFIIETDSTTVDDGETYTSVGVYSDGHLVLGGDEAIFVRITARGEDSVISISDAETITIGSSGTNSSTTIGSADLVSLLGTKRIDINANGTGSSMTYVNATGPKDHLMLRAGDWTPDSSGHTLYGPNTNEVWMGSVDDIKIVANNNVQLYSDNSIYLVSDNNITLSVPGSSPHEIYVEQLREQGSEGSYKHRVVCVANDGALYYRFKTMDELS